MSALRPLSLLLLGTLLGACDTTDAPPDHDAEYVVESYLAAGERLKQVRLSRTSAVNDAYDFETHAVSDADVQVSLLASDGSVEAVCPYIEIENTPGIYLPTLCEMGPVEPLRTYRLDVTVPPGDVVSATTVVPGAFEIVNVNTDTAAYQGGTQVAFDVTRSIYPDRQSIFIFSTESLDPVIENLTPFYRDVLDEDDLNDVRISQSPLINEDNYEANADGTLTIRLPWIAVIFYGRNRVAASAIDDNLYDFLRSQSVQQGGSTLSPGEIPNVIEHIEGGTGVFGSYARVARNILVTR